MLYICYIKGNKMIETIKLCITIISAAIGVITTIISICTNKTKSKSQKLVELAKVVQKLPGFIKEAEDIFGAGTGNAKMAWVLSKANMECLSKKIEFNEEQFKAEIENILKTPTTIKGVNYEKTSNEE